jgi:hypothetical protein
MKDMYLISQTPQRPLVAEERARGTAPSAV